MVTTPEAGTSLPAVGLRLQRRLLRRPRFLDPVFELFSPFENPVFMRSIRTRIRGGRFYLFMIAYVMLMVAVLGVTGLHYWQQDVIFQGSPKAETMGQAMFTGIVSTQMILLLVFTPLTTCGFIVGEREKQTFEMLDLSLLRNATILCGECLATLCFVFLLTLASLPLAGVCLMIGGISLSHLVMAEAALLITALFGASVGLLCSTLFRKRTGALMGCVFLMFFLTLGAFSFTWSEAAFLSAYLPAGVIPDLMEAGGNFFTYFNTTPPFWKVAFPFSSIISIFLLIIATRLMRDFTRAWLNLPLSLLLMMVVYTHFFGGLWPQIRFGSDDILMLFNAVLLLGVILHLAFTFGSTRPRFSTRSLLTSGNSPLSFLLIAGIAWWTYYLFVKTAPLDPEFAHRSGILYLATAFGYWSLGRLLQCGRRSSQSTGVVVLLIFLLVEFLIPLLWMILAVQLRGWSVQQMQIFLLIPKSSSLVTSTFLIRHDVPAQLSTSFFSGPTPFQTALALHLVAGVGFVSLEMLIRWVQRRHARRAARTLTTTEPAPALALAPLAERIEPAPEE